LNTLLSTGDVPNIFSKEDEDRIITEAQSQAVPVGGGQLTRELIYSSFIQRVRANLHVVLCLSAVPESLRQRLRMFPSLASCCNIEHFPGWPADALADVAEKQLADCVKPELRRAFVSACVAIHETAQRAVDDENAACGKHLYVTPATYLDLLALFKQLLARLSGQITAKMQRNQRGIEKLGSTEEEVRVLQHDAEVLKPELEHASKDVDDTVAKIRIEEAAAAEERKRVMEEEGVVKRKADEMKELMREAQR
jgi:dynein heavy chain